MPLTSLPNAAKYLIPDSLTHSSGVITAVINTVVYQVTLTGLTANTLYYLYVNNGSLVFVTTIPSSYRASNVNAILVGAFYSNGQGSVAFGSFCTIEGVPTTSQWAFVPTGAWNTNITYSGFLERRGDRLVYIGYFVLSGAPNAAQQGWNMPTNLSLDTSKITPNFGAVGVATAQDSGVASYMQGIQLLSSIMYPYGPGSPSNGQTTTSPFTWGNADAGTVEVEVPVVGWSNMPLKDL